MVLPFDARFVRLAEEGYDPFPVPTMIEIPSNWAFFPLYPMLIAGLRTATGLPKPCSSPATSLLLSVAAVRVAWPLMGKRMPAYILVSAFVLAGPVRRLFHHVLHWSAVPHPDHLRLHWPCKGATTSPQGSLPRSSPARASSASSR